MQYRCAIGETGPQMGTIWDKVYSLVQEALIFSCMEPFDFLKSCWKGSVETTVVITPLASAKEGLLPPETMLQTRE